jgi:hypothetical protein
MISGENLPIFAKRLTFVGNSEWIREVAYANPKREFDRRA